MIYDDLSSTEIFGPIAQQLTRNGWDIVDEKIVYATSPEMHNGWVYSDKDLDPTRDCMRWLHVFHRFYNILPTPCMGCFKVVMRPRTLEELFEIHKVQVGMGLPAKCGIESRQYVPHLYGAYWYAPLGKGLEPARRLHQEVVNMVESAYKEKGWEAPEIILKRGCTEFERAFGPSHEWVIPTEAHRFFDLLDATYAKVPGRQEHTGKKRLTQLQWIDYALNVGDETWKLYRDSRVCLTPMNYVSDNHGLEPLIEVI